MADPSEFPQVFAALKAILQKHAPALIVQTDSDTSYYLNTKKPHRNGGPMFFAAASIKKNYVSYYLMPVYCSADLLKAMSPALKKRMQGKACFNFTKVEPALFKELATLTRKGLAGFKKAGYA